jgi:Uma2 family endonuclease
MATQYAPRLLTAEEFLKIDFGDGKAELDQGVIYMMAGGSRRHARVATNIISALAVRLRGGPCAPYGSDMAIRTRPDSVRFPNVSVLCGKEGIEHDNDQLEELPVIIFEVLSASTSRTDLKKKLPEYKALGSLDTIVFVDIATERVRVVQRTGPKGWTDTEHDDPFDISLPALGIILPHAEIFAR